MWDKKRSKSDWKPFGWDDKMKREENTESVVGRKARKAYESGRLNEAERLLRAAAADSPRAAFNLGLILESQRRISEAVDAYRLAIDAGIQDAAVNLGNLLIDELDRPDEGLRLLRRAAASGDPDAMVNMGIALKKAGKPASAERWFRAAIRHGDMRAHANLGGLASDADDVARAMRHFGLALAAGAPIEEDVADWLIRRSRGGKGQTKPGTRRAK